MALQSHVAADRVDATRTTAQPGPATIVGSEVTSDARSSTVNQQPGQPTWRKVWSSIQVVVLSAAVILCIVMLAVGDRTLTRVWTIGAVFFGIALVGHCVFLWLTYRQQRR
jgi:hypothetical protein